jgi:hypothetical protein
MSMALKEMSNSKKAMIIEIFHDSSELIPNFVDLRIDVEHRL